jgi:signal transduction histidine kinase
MDEKGLELTLDVHNNVPEQVFGGAQRLQQTITDLLGNLVKFTNLLRPAGSIFTSSRINS